MKKNGYVRRFLALFLTLVMIMADSSVTTFAATVGMVSTQSLNYVDVRLNAPDGTYYVAAMKDNGSWYEAKSQVAEVEVTGGYADTTLSVSDISDAQIVLLRLKQGSYSQNYDQSNYAVIKSNNILDYTKKVSGGEINGDAAEINVTTIGNTTVSDVYGSLGSATNYAVFAGTFYNAGDMEGNIATDSFHSDGSDIGDSGNVGQYTERLKIHTTKTVSGLKDTETFKFGLFDSNDKLVQVKALTFSKDGTQSFNFDTIELGSSSGTGSSSYKYSVYELEESKSGQYTYGSGKYNKVSNTYKDFTVSYSENTAIEIFNNDNYVKTASGTVKLRDGNLYTTSKSGEISISGQVNNVKYGLSDSEFTSRVTNGEYSSGGVSAMINGKLKTLARDLGTAKSGNGTQVIYITPNVLTGNSVYLPYNGNILADSAEKLVINMIVPDGITELDLLGGDIGIVDVGGTNIKDGKNWSKAGLNIVWNYIKEDGTPFNGTVKLGGGQLPGIQLLPDGTLYSGNNVSQLDVAKILHQIGGEIHKAPIQGERTAYVNISNTGASGTYTPVVKKELSGRELKEGEFSFTIAEVDSAGNAVTGGYTDTKSNAADGTVTFDTITYTTAKTYYYKVIEKVPENKLPGVTYTTDSYIITVTVTNNGNGTLNASADKGLDNLVFHNSYTSKKTGITFSGTKTLEGKTLEAGKFTFVLQETDKNWKAKDGKAAVTATNGENGAYSFGKIEYTEAGTYYYTVSEQGKGTTVDGITYDATEYKITVTVTDDGKGKLVAKADREVNNLNFKNTYSSQKTEITFSGTKTLEGKTLEAGKFTFVLQETDKNWKAKDGKAAVTATNGENGAYSFGKIEYTEAGTYYYTVSEQGKGTTVEGITYDATEYKITVTVTDDGKGNLVAKADREVNNLDFKNSYSSQKTEITFSGTKTLEGKTLEAGKFTFVLQETDKNWKAKDGKAAVTATNGENGAYSFGKIEYTEAGTYYYTVSEQGKGTTVEGITYDATEYKITVTVTDDGKGNLVASADRKVDELNFTNTYKATGSTTLTATKTLTGRSFQSGDNWTFTVTASPTTAPMPEHPVITTSATSGNSETLNFGKINYTLKDVGTYVYTITESGNVTNVENDPNTARTVKVIVTDNGDGTLKVEQIEDAKNGLTFTNKYAEGETTLGVTKVLSGREFKDGDAWTFNLTADSETAPMPAETSVTTTATSGNSQSLTFGTIKYSLADVGNTYTYTITESGSGEGVTNDPNATRTVTVTVAEGSDGKLAITRTESEGGTVFTNIYNATGSLTLEANKKLKNKTLAAGAFSFELKELTAENTKVLETIPNEADGSVNFTTINYTLADVGTHTYTVSEVKGDDGTVTYDGTIYTVEATVTDAGNGTLNVSKVIKKNGEKVDSIDFTNTYVGEIEIAGTKTWNDNNDQEGIRPTSITVNLFANGEKVKDQKVTPDGNGNWNYKFEKLPEYNENGKITYTVTEDAVEGYTTELDGNNFINTHVPETTEISGTKTWNDAEDQDGKRPESITVKLLANGEEVNSQTVTAGEDGSWNYSFTNLPKFANGQEITYTVSETPVEDYTTTYDDNDIINSYTPGQTSATITKIWADADNQDGIRPESITVTLLADGKETGTTATLTAANNWTETITGLPEKANRKAIEYTWAEKDLPDGYELTDNSTDGTVTTLTNTHTTAVTSLSGTKTWEDADNQDGKRPESIIINLFADGKQIENKTVKADALGNWAYSFTNLPKFANGKEIVYTVTEDAVEGYTTKVDGNNFINSYKPETTEVSGTKNWNDAEDQDGKRPESITVRLLANGVEKDSQTVKADEAGSWTYKFTNLPKYEAGEEIVYTVTEDAVPDYTTEISGYDITNSYAPGKTSVTVTKAWVDNNNRDNHRPDAIKVQLKADGVSSGEEITLNAENNWTYTWSDLDQKKAGKDIAYTVEETGKAAGYISTVTGNAEEGFIITNTITSVKISKVDITDQKELAGAHIQVIDKDGNVVEEWDSTWEAHEVTGLKPGETYTLRETVAPEGYTLTSDTTFTLKEDGTVNKDTTTTTISDNGTLLVEDSRTSVKVSKVDISDGKELEGAHIQIIDQDGNVVDEWDSTKEAHVTEKLKTGKIYTLRETVAPDGYLLTSDTTFVLKEDGTVDAEKTTAVSKDGVLLVQDKLATSASIAVTKKLTYIGEGLAARNQTFYVALYSDKECTQRVSDVKALVFKNADASTVVFSENIKAGKTYYIAECTQDGTSQTIGALADGTVYEAVFGNGNSTTVTEADGTTTVSFENVFSSFPPDGFYKQGQLTITKKVLGADGGTRNSNEVFYAGIFDDAAHTQLSQQVEQNIIKLDMDGGYEVSEIINVGLAQSGAKVTLYVTETDSNGKPIAGSEGFGYKVTVSADSVIFDETNMTAEVVITNQEESTVTETPTPTPSSDGGNSGGSENHSGGYGGGKSPKTGDDTPIGTYLMLLLAAAMLAAETERRRRRNKRQ